MLIDTHCHLDPANCAEGPDAPIERARAAGVAALVVVGVGADLGPARHAVALATRRGDVFAAVGVHPHDASALDDAMLAELTELAAHPRVVAVGEAGLDYHYMHSPRQVQRRVFAQMIALARQVGKPLVVHTREARDDTLEVLAQESARDVGGVLHCYTEDRAFAERALDLGFDLSFSGIVTFKSARELQAVAAWAPADRVLVETDSPYLAPVPFRGKPCEPAYVVHTARFVAALRGEPFEAFTERSSHNAIRRLGLVVA